MITLFGYKNTRSLRVVWIMEELGESYQYTTVDFTKGQSQSSEYLAINPAGKVPAMRDDKLLLTESAAIINYLADKFSRQGLIPPAGSIERGKYDQWSHFAISELEQPLWTIAKHKFALPKAYRVKDVIPTAEWEFQKALKLFSDGLGNNQYILGDNFSGADILLAQTLFWATDFKQLIEHDNLIEYIGRCRQRPALMKAQQRENQAAQG